MEHSGQLRHGSSDEDDSEHRSKKERKEEKLDMILSEAGGIKETLGEITLSTNSNIPHPSRDF